MRLHEEFIGARRVAEAASLYAHASGRYPLTGVGDVNTYALFAETFFQLVSAVGRAGFISPTGVATDDTTKAFFAELVRSQRLVSLLSFYEVRRWFPATDDRKPFCLFTIGSSSSARFIYDIESLADLVRPEKWYQLTKSDFEQLNPNTRTLPIFRSQHDAELTKKLYRAAPVLIKEGQNDASGKQLPDENSWGISFQRMFDMSSDSGLFRDTPAGIGEARRLPLYEAKMTHQFDHRWATYVSAPGKPGGVDTADIADAQKADPGFVVRPRYWLDEREVLARIARVPARVAKAWLATHMAGVYADLEAEASLEFAVASWLAGELMRRTGGIRDEGKAATDKGLGEAYLRVLSRLDAEFRPLLDSLRQVRAGEDIGSFLRWAKQDAETPLSDNDLLTLQDWQQTFHAASSSGTRVQALVDRIDAWMDTRSPRWLMGWRDICRSTDERTVIAAVTPRVAIGHKLPVIRPVASRAPSRWVVLYANLCSLVLDYAARQKVGGTSLTYHYLKQFPVIPPDRYTESDLAFIVPRVLELTFTAHDLKPWADDLAAYDPRPAGQHGTPFAWNPERRAQLRAELDAYYARLYGLTRDELRYILDPADVMGDDYPSETFRVLKNNEMRAFGEYRTRRLVLAAWDALEAGALTPMAVPVSEHLPAVAYSEQGLVRNAEEAELAGLVAALVKRSDSGMSRAQLEEAVADAARPELFAAMLDTNLATQLRELAKRLPALAQPDTVSSVARFVQRLEGAGVIQRQRRGEVTYFVTGAGALPADVSASPALDALADVLVAGAARRGEEKAAESTDEAQSSRDRKTL